MDDARVLAALDRIGALDRSRARPDQLLGELRGLLREAEALAGSRAQTTTESEKEVTGALARCRHGT
jgi:hypothetical protein